MSANQKLIIHITCWHFPKWYEKDYSKGKLQRIEIEIRQFKSLVTLTKREPPYINQYLLLNGNNLGLLFEDISRLILNVYPNVSMIDLNTGSQKIYTTDLEKETESLQKIFDIPIAKNKASLHNKKRYAKFFNTSIFIEAAKEKKPFSSEFIGYTGKSKEALSIGMELPCTIFFDDPTAPTQEDFLYIKGVSTLQKKWSTGPVSEYYIFPEDILTQAQSAFELICDTHKNVQEIQVVCGLFDSSISIYSERTTDNFLFERNIEFYYRLSYHKNRGTQLLKQKKDVIEGTIESRLLHL
jgi:hypothetical protein